jgi:hypothetical protein
MTSTDPGEAPQDDVPAFRAGMRDTVEALRDLASVVSRAAARHGHLPSATSAAMSDLAAQAERYVGRLEWEHPLQDAHTFGTMTLVAAADYERRYADLFDSDRAPVYGGNPVNSVSPRPRRILWSGVERRLTIRTPVTARSEPSRPRRRGLDHRQSSPPGGCSPAVGGDRVTAPRSTG